MTALDEQKTTELVGQAPPRTVVPNRERPMGGQARRKLGGIRGTDVLALVGSLAASLTTTGLLWTQLSPFSGPFGYVVTSWFLFIVTYALLVSFDESRPTTWDRVTSAVVHS